MSDSKIIECEKDIEELKKLITQATRSNIKLLLESHLKKVELDLSLLLTAKTAAASESKKTDLTGRKQPINTYGWDESEKFVKVYITSLKDINKVKSENVTCDFKDSSFDLIIRNLENVNYTLSINNLLHNIDPKESSIKVKSDMITVVLKKQTPKTWQYLTDKEMKTKEKSKPKLNDNADPQDGLMSMMKQMYEDGDDEMKRTISKAFTESREKQMRGENTFE